MEMQDVMTRTNSIILGTDASRSTFDPAGVLEMSAAADWLAHLELKLKGILQILLEHSDFATMYDLSSREPGSPMIYVCTMVPSRFTYLMEAFPSVTVPKCEPDGKRQIDDQVYNSLFEAAIERYTKSNQKPNQALRDTRSSEFCYRVTIKVEAVPQESVGRPVRLTLLREFLILQHLWESYHSSNCGPDQMIGFPMPFEFKNVAGSEFDFNKDTYNCTYYNIFGKQEKIPKVTIPFAIPHSTTTIHSSLSYMSTEKMGPSLSYLMDLMRTQSKAFSMSSALKVFDQLICRLLVMHKYGVVHTDPNPACLFFGDGECCNVLYIGEFGSSIVLKSTDPMSMMPRFHDRFVSHLRFRQRKCHFVQDLESAFYVFMYLMLGRLPWDTQLAAGAKSESATAISMDMPTADVGTVFQYTDKTVTVERKEKFWSNQDLFKRIVGMIDLEFRESLYQSFAIDLLESLYAKTKELLFCTTKNVTSSSYSKDCSVPGSSVYNNYFGLRRIIATYFRFESLSPALKDLQANSKLDLLNKQCSSDSRVAWDVSHWCWNHLDPRPNQITSKSTILQRH